MINKAQDAATNMATDEAIMKLKLKPTLRLYKWDPPAVSIGYFQSLKREIDLEECKKKGVTVVRRITGGGAVFHDTELTYSFICPEDNVSHNIIESYEQICGAVVDGLKADGINAQFIPINDIIANGKKISGSAQTRKDGMVLQHGTILLDVDVEKMFSLLIVPDEKIRDKLIKNIKERVTSTKEFNKTDIEELQKCIVKSFKKRFDIEFEKGQLYEEEISLVGELKKKFNSWDWNNKR